MEIICNGLIQELKMQKWCIWYDDGSVFEGVTEADWIKAPAAGVLVIAARMGTDRFGRLLGEFFAGSDWYWFDTDRIIQNGVSTLKVNSWVDEPPNVQKTLLKRGKWALDDYHRRVVTMATQWLT